ncbi:cation:proton antiporter [Microbacterium sp. A84]|uniref:cation:proton antiporter n=1 Tax=Microbacterium sp. A84 TaxID=3450715 RepID=UPI003F437521
MDAVLWVVPLLAVTAPLLARGLSRWVSIPIVVFELLLGIMAGPSVLGWAGPSLFMGTLAQLGLAMLFFVAGSEIDFASLKGRTGRNATFGWLLSIAMGLLLGWLLAPGAAAVIIGVALCSTALGTVLPILRDAGEMRTPFGAAVGAIGAVGEFGPLLAISIFLGGRDLGPATAVMALFALLAGLAIWLSIRIPTGAMHRFINSTLHTSGQFAIRVVFLILTALLALSLFLRLDMLLGAFVAGVVWRLLMRDASEHDRHAVESKVEGAAFGFLIPLFFVYTGVTFDLAALIERPILFAMVPLVLVALLVVRGLPSMLAAPAGAGWHERISIGLLGATGLPIIVAVTAIGVSNGVLDPALQSVLVAGGMLSVLILPVIAMAIRGARTPVEQGSTL